MNCYGSLYTNLSYRIIFLTGGERPIGARPLEELLDKYNLVVINEEGVATRRSSEKVSIIDLAITLPSLNDSMTWYILGKAYSLISDYELIVVG